MHFERRATVRNVLLCEQRALSRDLNYGWLGLEFMILICSSSVPLEYILVRELVVLGMTDSHGDSVFLLFPPFPPFYPISNTVARSVLLFGTQNSF